MIVDSKHDGSILFVPLQSGQTHLPDHRRTSFKIAAVVLGLRLLLDLKVEPAVALWREVAAGSHRPSQARARLALLELGLRQKTIDPTAAIEELERLRFLWRGDQFEVMGQGYVAIYDHERQIDSGGRFYFLAPGDTFRLDTREAFRPSTQRRPLDRIEKRTWSPVGTGSDR